MELNKEIRRAVATGKVVIGADESLKTLKRGQAKLVIVASNCRPEVLADVQHYAGLADLPVHTFDGNSEELGLACGKPFLVGVLTIVEEGDSSIISLGARR
ncbi:MAG TPA: 50S ribosomal protein L30e [Desulfobacterales bacterium]|nr:50S ribosomal protein L30e [Desulfobacterales bacterium]